jgi:hypothetical protein
MSSSPSAQGFLLGPSVLWRFRSDLWDEYYEGDRTSGIAAP